MTRLSQPDSASQAREPGADDDRVMRVHALTIGVGRRGGSSRTCGV
jgi:hypothetical protein